LEYSDSIYKWASVPPNASGQPAHLPIDPSALPFQRLNRDQMQQSPSNSRVTDPKTLQPTLSSQSSSQGPNAALSVQPVTTAGVGAYGPRLPSVPVQSAPTQTARPASGMTLVSKEYADIEDSSGGQFNQQQPVPYQRYHSNSSSPIPSLPLPPRAPGAAPSSEGPPYSQWATDTAASPVNYGGTHPTFNKASGPNDSSR